MKKIFLDARELEHPKPLEQAIILLREIDNDSYFHMLHHKNPIPLLSLAEGQNFKLLSYEESECLWHILICKNRDIDLNDLIDNNSIRSL